MLTLPGPGATGSLGANKSIVIDTVAPTVTNVTSSTANGTYTTGQSISIQVAFSETVNVTGTPRLALNTGGTANYSSGSGGSTLVFTYTVAAGETNAHLDYTSINALSLNGGAINDAALNPAVLTLAAPGAAGSLGANKSFVINPPPTTVTNVTSTAANGAYRAGTSIAILVTFSATVAVTGTPQLALNSGGTASYSSGNGTATLTFVYTVAAGQSSAHLDYTSTSALTLNGGAITDVNSLAAVLTLPGTGAAGSLGANKSIVIDTLAPTVTDVTSSTANGTYTTGQSIAIQVGFSKAVNVTGTPKLLLNSGGTANFTSGSGGSTLVFTYTVAAGETNAHLDYSSISALSLNGGAINDAALNPAVLTLAEPGAAGSLGANKSFVIPAAATFVPMTPCRAVDTRNASGPLGGPFLSAALSRNFPLLSSPCGIPGTAQAYSVNVTVVPRGSLGYLSIWPTGQSQPLVSTLNSLDGRIKANAAIVPAGTGGAITMFATNETDVIIDVNGYFVPATTAGSLSFYPVAPCRVSDTRNPNGLLAGPMISGGSTRSIPVLSSACGLPSNATAYSLNFTAVPRGPLGYITVWPAGATTPLASTLNALTGAVTANAAITPAGSGGAINVFATNDTDLIVDVNGYFAPPGGLGALSFYAMTPCRVVDTRNPAGPLGGPSLAGQRDFPMTTSPCGIPDNALAYSLNATAVPQASLGYLTLWSSGSSIPLVSTLNALDGSTTSNAAIVPAASGKMSAYTTGPGRSDSGHQRVLCTVAINASEISSVCDRTDKLQSYRLQPAMPSTILNAGVRRI